jgi:pilus assembly protein Flp/PilA
MLKYLVAIKAYTLSERGATMVEYGILVALISVVAILAIAALGTDVFGAFDNAQKEVGPVAPTPCSGC